ncbi:MAG: AAA family ATPase [Planctomycetota bacterium]
MPLAFERPVTFLVGENGTGKSTLIEAIAKLSSLPVSGGSRNEAQSTHGPESDSPLAQHLRPVFTQRPLDGFFLRAEFGAHFASLLDERKEDPAFWEDPYGRYGGKSLHTRSHGEAFLEILQSQIDTGLFLMDEPESALSPQRQLVLLAMMYDRIRSGLSQFIIATHSPILLTFPHATILSFDDGHIEPVHLQDTAHYQITKGILEHPERYWRHLREDSQKNKA